MIGFNKLSQAIKLMLTPVLAFNSLLMNQAHAETVKQVERPTQYVLLAFDGSYRNQMWQYLRDYSQEHKQNNVDVRFTFFINPVYLMSRQVGSSYYHPPAGLHGSAIGWGDDYAQNMVRVDHMNAAYDEGHEIGSHAVGHWNGQKWSAADWHSELTQFYDILDNVFSLNKSPEKKLNFRDSIQGFRAPLLGYGKGLYQELPKFGIKYDTSQIGVSMSYWPEKRKDSGTWNFPLGLVPIPGTAKHYPTMDYNFCANDTLELLRKDPSLIDYSVAASNGKKVSNKGHGDCLPVVPDKWKTFIGDRAYEAYMGYFNSNYYGSRAPVSIGHHFSAWMSGAYFEAMMKVADTVCSKPDVKCVTYSELMEYMNQKEASGELRSIRAGAFDKLPQPKALHIGSGLNLQLRLLKEGDSLATKLTGKDASIKGLTVKYYVNNSEATANDLSMTNLKAKYGVGSNIQVAATVLNRRGQEIAASTHVLEKLGTADEKLSEESLEAQISSQGDTAAAHAGEGGM